MRQIIIVLALVVAVARNTDCFGEDRANRRRVKFAINAVNAVKAKNSIKAKWAGTATNAKKAENAGVAKYATNAMNAKDAENAEQAMKAENAKFATFAKFAKYAYIAENASVISPTYPPEGAQGWKGYRKEATRADTYAFDKVNDIVQEEKKDDEKATDEWSALSKASTAPIDKKRRHHKNAIYAWKAINSVNAKTAKNAINAFSAKNAGKAKEAKNALWAEFTRNAKSAKNAKNARKAKLAKNAEWAMFAKFAKYAKKLATKKPPTKSTTTTTKKPTTTIVPDEGQLAGAEEGRINDGDFGYDFEKKFPSINVPMGN